VGCGGGIAVAVTAAGRIPATLDYPRLGGWRGHCPTPLPTPRSRGTLRVRQRNDRPNYCARSPLRSSAAPVHAHSTNFGLAGAAPAPSELGAWLDCVRRVRPRDSGESFHRPRGWIATWVFVVALAASRPNCQHGWGWRPPASWASRALSSRLGQLLHATGDETLPSGLS